MRHWTGSSLVQTTGCCLYPLHVNWIPKLTYFVSNFLLLKWIPVHNAIWCIMLTYWGRVAHICVSKLGHQSSAPSHHLKERWHIANWIHGNNVQWNLNQDTTIFIRKLIRKSRLQKVGLCDDFSPKLVRLFDWYLINRRFCRNTDSKNIPVDDVATLITSLCHHWFRQ